MSINIRHTTSILIVLALLVLGLGVAIVAGRWLLVHMQVDLETKTSTTMSQEEERLLARMLHEQYEKASPQLTVVTSFVAGAADDQGLAFIQSIEALARHVGVPVAITYAGSEGNMVFGIKAGGSFSKLYRLIGLIETSPYPVVVEALSLAVSGEGESKQWSLDSTLRLIVVSTTTSSQVQ